MALNCARPANEEFQTWLQGVENKAGAINCDRPDGTLSPAAKDRAALVALYYTTGGPNWATNSNWMSDRPLGEWYGVTTDGDGLVTRLDISDNQLNGSIPAALGNLTNLQELHLYINELSGPIPAELGSLANLEILRLGGNQLSGAIPVDLGSLSSLQSLDLGNNQLSGAIPAELGSLANLQELCSAATS